MAWTAPHTFVLGETVTPALMNNIGGDLVHVEAGNVSHVYAGGVGPVSTVITFAVPFSIAPSVTLGCSSFQLQVEYGTLTNTGFTLFSKGFNNVIPTSATYGLSWIAVGT